MEEITPKILDTYLHAFKHGGSKPPEMLNLHGVDFAAAASNEEKHFQVFEWLEARVRENLLQQRHNQGNVAQYQGTDWRRAMQLDFQQTNSLLESWSALHYRYFVYESQSFEDLALSAGCEPRQLRRRLENGLKELCAVIQRAEMEAHRRQRRVTLGASIPNPDYQQLFGIHTPCAQICAWLSAPDGPKMISLEGMGGIGKTCLAQAVTEALLSVGQVAFRDILWVSVRQELLNLRGEIEKINHATRSIDDIVTDLTQALGLSHLAGLRTQEKLEGLKSAIGLHPYLIVIDNLETLQEARALLPLLRKISGPSRFLFTSRKSLGAFPSIQVLTVPELSFADSCKLIENEVGRRWAGFKLSRASAEKISAAVGGLPLALKLVAAQISEFSEKYVLENIGAFEPGKSQTALYTYIYKTSWGQLDDASRQLLLSMLLVSQNGDSLEWIKAHSGLPEGEFENAFSRLMDFSLVETHSIQAGGRYSLHRLTQSFLKSRVLKEWGA